jgi:hypothetical protein
MAKPVNSGWNIRLICQTANSPDLNILDLAFFSALQSVQHELIAVVKKAFDKFPLQLVMDEAQVWQKQLQQAYSFIFANIIVTLLVIFRLIFTENKFDLQSHFFRMEGVASIAKNCCETTLHTT